MQLTIMQIAVFFTLIPIIVGLLRHSRIEREAKWLLYLLIPIALNQFLSVWWIYYIDANNLPFYFFYIILETIGLSKIYYSYLNDWKNKFIIPLLAVFFLFLYVVHFILEPENLWTYSTYLRALEGGIILIFTGVYFFKIYRKQEILNLYNISGFWISAGLIIYFTCNLLLFIFSEFVYGLDDTIFQSVWAIHAILSILLHTLFSIAMLCKKTEVIS